MDRRETERHSKTRDPYESSYMCVRAWTGKRRRTKKESRIENTYDEPPKKQAEMKSTPSRFRLLVDSSCQPPGVRCFFRFFARSPLVMLLAHLANLWLVSHTY